MKYGPSGITRLGRLGVVLLLLLATGYWIMLLTLMVNKTLNESSDWESWLLPLGGFGFAMFLYLLTWDSWKKIVVGIVIRETGLSIYGYEIPWEDIEAVYTNPDLPYVSIQLSRPIGLRDLTKSSILKNSISQLDDFFEQLTKLGTVIKQENVL
jgi:hypothetical protein